MSDAVVLTPGHVWELTNEGGTRHLIDLRDRRRRVGVLSWAGLRRGALDGGDRRGPRRRRARDSGGQAPAKHLIGIEANSHGRLLRVMASDVDTLADHRIIGIAFADVAESRADASILRSKRAVVQRLLRPLTMRNRRPTDQTTQAPPSSTISTTGSPSSSATGAETDSTTHPRCGCQSRSPGRRWGAWTKRTASNGTSSNLRPARGSAPRYRSPAGTGRGSGCT